MTNSFEVLLSCMYSLVKPQSRLHAELLFADVTLKPFLLRVRHYVRIQLMCELVFLVAIWTGVTAVRELVKF